VRPPQARFGNGESSEAVSDLIPTTTPFPPQLCLHTANSLTTTPTVKSLCLETHLRSPMGVRPSGAPGFTDKCQLDEPASAQCPPETLASSNLCRRSQCPCSTRRRVALQGVPESKGGAVEQKILLFLPYTSVMSHNPIRLCSFVAVP
jgi:hypothetical protein